MVQMWEIGTDSPCLVQYCKVCTARAAGSRPYDGVNDKQQFVGMLRQADQHIRLLHTQKGKHDETICSYYSLRFVAGWDDRVSFQRQYSTH